MHGADRPGIAVVGHARDLAQPGLVKARVGHDDRERRVSHEFVVHNRVTAPHEIDRTAHRHPVLGEQAGHLCPGLPVVDVPQGVEHDHRADFQRADLHGVTADTRLHAVFHTGDLAHGRAAARAMVAVPVIGRFQGMLRGCIAHHRVRANARVAHAEVVDVRLDDQRNPRKARIVADAAFLEILHYTVRRAQAVGAAAGEHNGMNRLLRRQRIEQMALPAGRAAAPHVQPGAHARFTDEHRASGARLHVLHLANMNALYPGNGNLSHG